ncbi:MAG TPA: PIN domain-containing protein [Telluria sp.]|nr:PIN domain-containing protein [Telluria sp.]
MSAAENFFDTNVILYLLSADTGKADRAEVLLTAGGTISVQVLNEFANVARRKLGKSWKEVRDILDILKAVCAVEPVSLATHEKAIDIAEQTGYSIDDSLVLAAATIANCHTVYSEDMQHGQVIEGRVTIRNPFL